MTRASFTFEFEADLQSIPNADGLWEFQVLEIRNTAGGKPIPFHTGLWAELSSYVAIRLRDECEAALNAAQQDYLDRKAEAVAEALAERRAMRAREWARAAREKLG